MKQPSISKSKTRKRKRGRGYYRRKPKNIKYGTSKLEVDFANDFLDKNGIKYIYQYEAKDIGRFYDFAIVRDQSAYYETEEINGLNSIKTNGQSVIIDFLIEIDGGYYHSDPRVVDESKLNYMQRRNKAIDEIKNKWANRNSLQLVRIWEYDIRHNKKKVEQILEQYISITKHKEKTHNKKLI